METKWLEDFLSLAGTGSFSQSAVERNVTQPAFSRRIKALEEWVGVALIDRSTYPTRLTEAGVKFLAAVRAVRTSLQNARQELRQAARADRQLLRIAIQHTLASGFLARWLASLPLDKGDLLVRVQADNRHDCVRGLEDGNVDLLVCYTHPDLPLQLDPARYSSLVLASDRLVPVSRPAADGRPLHALRADARQPVPWLSYTPEAFLGQAVARVLSLANPPIAVHAVLESALVETLRAATLEGLGAAWLPASLIAGDLNSKALVRAGPTDIDVQLTVTAYAERSVATGRLRQIWEPRSARA
jgi:DNA-binding transcriptional LysR family regulator